MKHKLLVVTGAVIVAGAAIAGVLYAKFPVQMTTYGGMGLNFLKSLSSPAGTLSIEINPAYKARELEYVLKNSEAVGLFTMDGYRGDDALAALDGVRAKLPRLRKVIRIAEFDSPRTGFERAAILANLLSRAPALARVAERADGGLAGYALGRDGYRAWHVGPIVADHEHKRQAGRPVVNRRRVVHVAHQGGRPEDGRARACRHICRHRAPAAHVATSSETGQGPRRS